MSEPEGTAKNISTFSRIITELGPERINALKRYAAGIQPNDDETGQNPTEYANALVAQIISRAAASEGLTWVAEFGEPDTLLEQLEGMVPNNPLKSAQMGGDA